MGKLELENMIFYSRHGCFHEEQLLGNKFIVDFSAESDISKAAESDDLNDSVDYQEIYKVIKEEMAIPSKLLENVAGRIINRIKDEFPSLSSGVISIKKTAPPIGGEIGAFKISLSFKR